MGVLAKDAGRQEGAPIALFVPAAEFDRINQSIDADGDWTAGPMSRLVRHSTNASYFVRMRISL